MFVSLGFPVFLGIVAALFFLLPAKWRLSVLLAASYIFCGWIQMRALAVLVLVSLCTWAAGKEIERQRARGSLKASKICVGLLVVFYIVMLCVYKYLPSYLGRFGLDEHLPEGVMGSLVMPVGLSFYLFQAIGYLVDIYKGKSKAEGDFLALSCYLAFFPKLVSGPIEREQDLLPQLKNLAGVRFWDRGRLSTAFTYMLWGYFMKLVVADRLAVIVNQIFDNPSAFDSFWLILGMFFYTMQIYCDFAGYSYIAIGCAKIFGLELSQNFKAPYFAKGVADFWRRWHVTLGAWLRDYIYIPLGGNRKGITRKCINMVVVFLVCGMWHGAGLNFVIWGLLHGFYSVVEIFGRKMGWRVKGGQALTFISVAFAWIFFRAGSLRAAIAYVARMCTAGIETDRWQQMAEMLQLNIVESTVALIGIAVVWAVDGLCSRKKLHLPVMVQDWQNAARYLIFYLLIIVIFIFGMYGPGYHAEQFIYMQF